MCLIAILFSVFAARFCVVSTQNCGYLMYFTPNGTYDINRRLALSTLASKVSSGDGYYNMSLGEGKESVYVMGLCIPGTESEACSNCIQGASLALIQKCVNETDSFQWRGDTTLCFVRYSNHTFADSLDLDPTDSGINTQNITGNITEFNRNWNELMTGMIGTTSSSTPGSPTQRHYAANITVFTGFQEIYTLMQCIPEIASWDCATCLHQCVQDYKDCCSEKQGGTIQKPSCFFRWDLYAYLGAFVNVKSSPPPPPPDIRSIQPAPSPPPGAVGSGIPRGYLILIGVLSLTMLGLFVSVFLICKQKKRKTDKDITSSQSQQHGVTAIEAASSHPVQHGLRTIEAASSQPVQYRLMEIEAATNYFSENNKLGQGGFGVVFKGTFPNGTEVAVKRLSINSNQGFPEFKNEIIVVAKLQHINLVKLLGYCFEGKEKILVYEFLSNKSLDFFLFDPVKRVELDWNKWYIIIKGISRGILYLHRDSRPKIIHRDLKVSNILLDADMKPKIADFGLAKIFDLQQSRAATSRIAGTFGYMAPEYMDQGEFSTKSDVYSFGVLVLEIISGTTSGEYYSIDGTTCNLVTYSWRLWRKGSALDLVDPTFRDNYPREIAAHCIQIALLCVQKKPCRSSKYV